LITLNIQEEADSQWNDRLLKSELATIYQTREWGNLLRGNMRKPLFFQFIDEKGEIVGQVLIFMIRNFKENRLLNKLITAVPKLKKSLYSWSYGPIIFDNTRFEDIMNKLIEYCNSQKFQVKGVGHPLLQNDISFLKSKIQINVWITFLIHLTNSTEILYQKIEKHSGRKNIERSIKRGVEIEEITYSSLSDYVDLLNEGKDEKQKTSLKDMQLTWNTLKPFGYSGMLAKKNGMPLGGLMFSFLQGHIIEAGVARSEEDQKHNLYSQDLIKWKIIEWGTKNKMKYYNLAGANPTPTSKKELGILRYKQKWGGKQYDYWILKR